MITELAADSATRRAGWSPAPPPDDYVLGPVSAVLPDRVLDEARIVVRGGVLAEIGPHRRGTPADLDGRGLTCLPGLVDVHSDALTTACRPRPGAAVPVDFALASAEASLSAAGVTTAFHGVGFQAHSAVGIPIGSPGAAEVYDVVAATTRSSRGGTPDTATVEHRILHRLDIRCPVGIADLERRLAATNGPTLVSHEDHTPGLGQYADPATMRRWLVEAEGLSPEQAGEHVDRLTAVRAERADLAATSLAWLGELATTRRIRLLAHDPATEDDVTAAAARGARVAEFPTTLRAAEAARRAGLLVLAGAPNLLRGGSHSGNVSAAELVAAGLVDGLASDYLPTAPLAAATELVRRGLSSLPAAIGLVTSGPATIVGLDDRGALVLGRRADLVLADLSRRWPRVALTLRASTRRETDHQTEHHDRQSDQHRRLGRAGG